MRVSNAGGTRAESHLHAPCFPQCSSLLTLAILQCDGQRLQQVHLHHLRAACEAAALRMALDGCRTSNASELALAAARLAKRTSAAPASVPDVSRAPVASAITAFTISAAAASLTTSESLRTSAHARPLSAPDRAR